MTLTRRSLWLHPLEIVQFGAALFILNILFAAEALSQAPGSGTAIPRLAAQIEVPGVDTLIVWGQEWRYNSSGKELDTAWITPGYNDSSWSKGVAPLGYGNTEVVTQTDSITTATYFRKTFTVSNASQFKWLLWDAWVDDGVVVYLNGKEVYRYNMPAGTVKYNTYALSSKHEHALHQSTADLLVDGKNVVAVSLHNRDSSRAGDRSLDLLLVGKRPITPVTFIIDDTADTLYALGYSIRGSWNYLPSDSSVLVYDASWGGGTRFYFALRDDGTHGDSLAGDHRWTKTLSFLTDFGANPFRWGVHTPKNEWITEGPSFSLPDTTPVSVVWFSPPANARVTFKFHDVFGQVISSAPAGQKPYITIPGGGFNGWNPLVDTLKHIGDSVFSITIANLSKFISYEYKYYINGQWNLVQTENRSITVTDSVMVVDDFPIGVWPSRTLVSNASEWKYNDTGADLGNNWIELNYDDSAWKSGSAQFGHGDGDEATVTAEISSATYFRKKFTAEPALIIALFLTTLYDDGFVAYLNGTEIDRANMPTGAVNSKTYALSSVENEMRFVIPVNKNLLVNGVNVLAVSVHNKDSSPTGDISFDQALSFEAVPLQSDTLIAWGQVWKYNSTGADLGTAWINPAYDDAAWRSGLAPLGYGNTEVVTVTDSISTATYFRKSFTVSDPTQFKALSWDTWKDDGVVVYLNWSEVYRSNMPTGPVSYNTYASSSKHDHALYESDASRLVAGKNVVAASLHNRDSDRAGDRSLDLLLIGKRTVTSVDAVATDGLPRSFHLFQNYPNPFNPSTVIRYSIPEQSHVTLRVFNVLGQEFLTMVNEVQAAGTYKAKVNLSHFPSGVYLYRLQAGAFVDTKKMLLAK